MGRKCLGLKILINGEGATEVPSYQACRRLFSSFSAVSLGLDSFNALRACWFGLLKDVLFMLWISI